MGKRTASKVYVSYGKTIMENFLDRLKGGGGVADLRDLARPAVKSWANDVWGESAKIKWDKHCGCGMCPCSPGWRVMVDESKVPFYSKPKEHWVEVKDDGNITVS